MIQIINVNSLPTEYRCLSTDEKPVGDFVPNGAALIEMDTAKVFMFDKSTATWIELK